MAGSRTLKLSILADVDDLKKKLGDSNKEVETFGNKVSDFGKKAGLAFAAAGAAAAAYAGKLLVDGVKSAIADEAAQAKLAGTLERVAGASEKTVAAVEAYITKTSLAIGITDDQLRPAFDRLVRSTGDVGDAQTALNVALNISAATGKSLETVTAAVGKALDGNATSLGKVAGGFEASELKGKSFADLLPELTERFGGAAQEQAETFAVKMDRLGIAFDEAKETAGAFILDAITPLITKFVDEGIPAITAFGDEVGDRLGPIIEKIGNFVKNDFLPAFRLLYGFLNETLIPFIKDVASGVFAGLSAIFNKVRSALADNKDEFKRFLDVIKPIVKYLLETLAPVFKTILPAALSALGSIIGGIVTAFGKLAGAVANVVDGIKDIINLVKNNPIVSGISNVIDRAFGGGRATGGAVNSSQSYLVGERGPELFVPNSGGRIMPNNSMGGQNIVINVNAPSVIDQEGFSRAVILALNNSTNRGTIGAGDLRTSAQIL
jgi:hypothetical protein